MAAVGGPRGNPDTRYTVVSGYTVVYKIYGLPRACNEKVLLIDAYSSYI